MAMATTTTSRYKFVNRDQPTDIIDVLAANKFKWEWLTLRDANEDFLSIYIRKIEEDGIAWCCFCKTELKYGRRGVGTIKDHAKSKVHQRNRALFMTNQSLPAAMQATCNKINGTSTSSSFSTSTCVSMSTIPYGAASNLDCLGLPQESTTVPDIPKPVCLKDRVSHQESLVISFMAEHTLPLSLAPDLIKLAQELSKDSSALKKLHLERQTATYKLKHGLARLEHIRLVNDMKNTPFSLNIDESTSKGSKKRILNILVSFFSDHLKQSVCHLYASIELTVVNASTVFEAVRNKFYKDEIPLTNLISVLSDSAAYMRGSLNGFHKKLKEIVPHLLDIDGDLCHHIHNAVGKFTSIIDSNKVVTKLLDDLFRDFDYSPDLREDLKEVCKLLGMKECVLLQRAGHRWMSIFDASSRLIELQDALAIFYSAWLTIDERKEFRSEIDGHLKGVKDGSGKERILHKKEEEDC